MLRTFLPILTYPDAPSNAGLRRALDLAATLEAEVLATIVEIDIPPISRPLAPIGVNIGALVAEVEALSRSQAEESANELRREAKRLNLKLNIDRTRSQLARVEDVLSVAARVHDYSIMVMGEGDDERGVAEALIFQSGGPVILIPGNGDGPVHLLSVAVAWDGSRACARAFRDALSLLEKADRVFILSASADKEIDSQSGERACAMLEDRGVAYSKLEVIVTSGRPIGEALQEAAIHKGAGLLVMGGYGQSRIREFVLGGATRSVLANPRLPVLMSH